MSTWRGRREHRFDPLSGEGVVLCADRRPDLRPPRPQDDPVPCVFCAGNEARTGRTLDQLAAGGSWTARAVANQVPALRVELAGDAHQDGPCLAAGGLGAHEVLVESPEHGPLLEQPVSRSIDALRFAVRRMADLRRDRRLRTLAWSRDVGSTGPDHAVSSLVALPYVPTAVEVLTERSVAWTRRHGRPLLAEVVALEEREGRRVVWSGDHVLAFCPFAPRASFEVWFVPRAGVGHPADAVDAVVVELARAVHAVGRALEGVLGWVPTALSTRGGAVDAPPEVGWHLRLRPRTVAPTGFEDATGTVMVGVFPEECADHLRAVLASAGASVP